jgi:hypothetical protein
MKRGRTSATGPQRPLGTFRREGEYWTIAYAGVVVRLRDTKGLQYLGQLLRHPGRAFPVAELAGLLEPRETCARDGTGASTDGAERIRKAVTNRIRQTVARIGAAHEPLGLHLGNTVHTGGRCMYTPERPLRWGV